MVLHHHSLPSSLWHRAHIRATGRHSRHIAVTCLLHAQNRESPTNLKDTSVGIKAAGIENGIFPLVETCNLLLQVFVYALKRREKRGSPMRQYKFLLARCC